MFILPTDRSAAWVRPQRTARLYRASHEDLRPCHQASNRIALRPESALGHAGEKLISRQVAVTPQKPVDWGAVVGKVSIALKEQASEARAAAWAKTMEKLRSRQMALKEQAAPMRTTGREFDRVWYGHCPDEAHLSQSLRDLSYYRDGWRYLRVRPKECSVLSE